MFEQPELLCRSSRHGPQALSVVPSGTVRARQLLELGVVERQMHHHRRVQICSPLNRCFVDDEFDGGVAVAALGVVSIPNAHERVTEAACQLQGAGLRCRETLDNMGGGIRALQVARRVGYRNGRHEQALLPCRSGVVDRHNGMSYPAHRVVS